MKKFHAVFFTDMSSKIWHVKPLGAYRLASELRSNGYSVLVIDYFSKWLQDKNSLHSLIDSVCGDQTLFVGYSATFFSSDIQIKSDIKSYGDYRGGLLTPWPVDVNEISGLNQYIKSRSKNIKIFYGGSGFPSTTPELEKSGIDYFVEGFADSYIVDILDDLSAGRDLKHNILKKTNGIKVLDYDVRGEKFDFVNSLTDYDESDIIESGEILPLETSRGCIFKCKFCAFPLLGRKKTDPAYHKNIESISKEIKQNYEKFGIYKYMFVDDTFNETTEKIKQIKSALDEAGVKIEFSAYLRMDLLERYPEQIDLLREIGLKSAFFGVETLNEKSARAVGKSSSIELVDKCIGFINDSWKGDVAIFGSFIAGLPYDDKVSVNDWMQWVYQQEFFDSYFINALGLHDRVWKSELNRDPGKFGYTINDSIWTNNVGFNQIDAWKLSNYWMEKSWNQGRFRVAGWELMGLQTLGYTLEELNKYSLDTLPFQEFGERQKNKFLRYKTKLFEYIG